MSNALATLTSAATTTSVSNMVCIPAGDFVMGSDRHYPEEAPSHRRQVAEFRMDAHLVTNVEFARFVAETGYVTVAQRRPDPADYPGVPATALVAGSAVFTRPSPNAASPEWWAFVAGACWSAPEGPGSDIFKRGDHPVVHVAFDDAVTYAAWAGKRLPGEVEWERAARGGADGCDYVWGNEARPDGAVLANYWTGSFPDAPEATAACATTPVGTYPPNPYGLFDMSGNVWEWTVDPFTQSHGQPSCCTAVADPLQVGGISHVLKGGSFLCADNACARYRPAARIPQSADSSASNVGFRCATSDLDISTTHHT